MKEAKRLQESVKYVAHRGYSMQAPENTLPAFELAGESGFWGIELDTYCTVDGHWIVHHDRTVDRMTNGTGAVHEHTLAQIEQLEIRAGHNIEQYSNLKIPKLEDVLELNERYQMHVFVEVKGYHKDEDLKRLVELLQQSGIHRYSVIDFEAENLRKIRAITKQLPLGYLIGRELEDSDIAFIQQLGSAFLDANYTKLTVEDVKRCHAQGVEAAIWTVNDFAKALPFIEAKVDYITTDTALHQAGGTSK